ncbi:MAG: Gfo/Idh/MocA family oxidoreductase [Planctomycetota bacterium]
MAAVTAVGLAGASRARAAESANDRLNIACVGVGGRGEANVQGVAGQNLVAMVDVDSVRAAKSFEAQPSAKRYTDYRRMLDELGGQLDAVVISTPDHTHFHPALAAMQLGLHVYLEKPLAHNLWETRTLTDYARQQGLATQLGTQRHALPTMHRAVELVQSGAIGTVSEVHCWIASDRGMPTLPADQPTPPETLDYDLWLGPVAEARPYHPSFCPYGWRFWWDFGTGETGNWGCHILDIPFRALGLRHPTRIDATGPEVDAERTPESMRCEFLFPESNQGTPVKLHWGQGVPAIVRGLELPPLEEGEERFASNTLFIGSEGMLLCGFDGLMLLPADEFIDFEAPEPFVPDSPGFYREWIDACRGGEPATCHFDYSGPLSETVLLGNVAYRADGFDWDAEGLTTGGNAKAQSLVKVSYRPGWEL